MVLGTQPASHVQLDARAGRLPAASNEMEGFRKQSESFLRADASQVARSEKLLGRISQPVSDP